MLKKILFISQYLNRNGTEAFMMNVFRGIDRSRFHIDFLIFTDEVTDYTTEVENAGGTVYRLPNRKTSMRGYYKNLDRFFRNHGPEYVAIHFCGNSLSSMAHIYYAYKYGVPVRIVHSHNSSARGIHNKVLHLLKRKYVKSITTHHFACSSLAAKWFFGSSESVIIKNGINTKLFAFDNDVRKEMRTLLGVNDATVVIGTVGRIVQEKNHTFMLDIYSEYAKMNPDSKLLIVGIGPLMDEMKQKAYRLGIKEKVCFLGERSDVNKLMQAMDLFLMPSLFEGLPFVLIEAQCAGLPCVISDTINKDIKIAENVVFCSLKSSATEWSSIIKSSLKTIDRYKGAGAVSSASYSIENTVRYLENVYNGNL